MAAQVPAVIEQKGTWTLYQPSNARRNLTILVSIVAIAALIAGGVMHRLELSKIGSISLMAGGGGILLAVVIGLAIKRAKRKGKDTSYRVVSWNVGSERDYANMCAMKELVPQFDSLKLAAEHHSNPHTKAKDLTKQELNQRTTLFQQAFNNFGDVDVMCLQETTSILPILPLILPSHLRSFTYWNREGRNCTLVWNASKFSVVGHANLNYDPEYIPAINSAPNTMILLQDNQNGNKICVGSSHVRGYNLKASNAAFVLPGDNQVRYDLATINQVQADLYIYAGDFNAPITGDEHAQRFNILAQNDFQTDLEAIEPTIFDANLRTPAGEPSAVRLDYVFFKAGNDRRAIAQEKMNLQPNNLLDFNRPSDHLPVGMNIALASQRRL